VKAAACALLLLAAYYRSGPLLCAVGVPALLAGGARLWLQRVAGQLRAARSLEHRLFFGETCTVTLTLANGSGLPIPWLEVHESLPAALALPSVVSRVLRLGSREREAITYQLHGRRRGVHAIGPTLVTAGDVFGLARRELRFPAPRYLLVYPRILPAAALDLPALALFGEVRSRRPLLGDPARVAGVRAYRAGDPPHDIHWRASAATGALQVKQYQPATTVQTVIVLDLHRPSYRAADALAATELAVSVAATVASRLIEARQEVGLVTNGHLPLLPEQDLEAEMTGRLLVEMRAFSEAATAPDGAGGEDAPAASPAPIGPAKGGAHLMRILELLARITPQEQGEPLLGMLVRRSLALPWGSTVVVVTGSLADELLVTLHRLREAGLLVVLFLVERRSDGPQIAARARALGVMLRLVWQDLDLQTATS
jgi:uncharacterized protein (DUF58 family)